jgi:hypothetical protein
MQSGYKEENLGNQLVDGLQLSSALQGRPRRDGTIVQVTVEFCTGSSDKRT